MHLEGRKWAIAPLFCNHGSRWRWVLKAMPRQLYPPGNGPIVPTEQGADWASGPVWMGAANLGPVGFRTPKLPGRTELHRPPKEKAVCV